MRCARIWPGFGVIAPRGLRHVEQLIAAIDADDLALPELARAILRLVVAQLNDTQAKIRQLEAKLAKWHRSDRVSKLLATVPGVGIVGASAIAATVSDPSLFRSRPEFAAWHDAAPKFLGGKERLGRTSKRGDKYIRFLLVAGAAAVLRHGRNRATKDAEWVRRAASEKIVFSGATGMPSSVVCGGAVFHPASGLTWRLFIAGCNSLVEPVLRAARKKPMYGDFRSHSRVRFIYSLPASLVAK
ncbi:MAG TPA: transposase [Methylocella sp.]|nr:transposase [Methylocella sp.]